MDFFIWLMLVKKCLVDFINQWTILIIHTFLLLFVVVCLWNIFFRRKILPAVFAHHIESNRWASEGKKIILFMCNSNIFFDIIEKLNINFFCVFIGLHFCSFSLSLCSLYYYCAFLSSVFLCVCVLSAFFSLYWS